MEKKFNSFFLAISRKTQKRQILIYFSALTPAPSYYPTKDDRVKKVCCFLFHVIAVDE